MHPRPTEHTLSAPQRKSAPEPADFRAVALDVYRQAEAIGDDDWRRAIPEEKAAAVAGRILTVAGAAAQLEACGYAGPGAQARYEADMATVNGTAAGPVPARVVGAVPARTIGARTAYDLDYGPAPAQLAEPYIAPRGVTVLYGKGGTGKGITAAHLVCRLVRAGHVIMIVDYEGHPDEWGSRLRGLGLTDDELRQVVYREPYGPDWSAPKGPLRNVAHLVRTDAARVGATVLIVDSYTTATSTGDTMGGAAAAQEFFAGCAMIGLPTLVLAHVRGDGQRFPEKPFGSVFVHNLARETWAEEALDPDDGDPGNPFAPEIVRLELRNMKRNRGGRRAPQFLTFAFSADGSIDATEGTPNRRLLADLIDVVLEGPMTPETIARAIAEDTGETPSAMTVRRTLNRHPRRFVADTTKRPHRWSRRP